MSDITGSGWGFDHDWKCLGTSHRSTAYRCRKCEAAFWHDYPRVPQIGKAMFEEGVPEHCPSASSAPER